MVEILTVVMSFPVCGGSRVVAKAVEDASKSSCTPWVPGGSVSLDPWGPIGRASGDNPVTEGDTDSSGGPSAPRELTSGKWGLESFWVIHSNCIHGLTNLWFTKESHMWVGFANSSVWSAINDSFCRVISDNLSLGFELMQPFWTPRCSMNILRYLFGLQCSISPYHCGLHHLALCKCDYDIIYAFIFIMFKVIRLWQDTGGHWNNLWQQPHLNYV